MIDVNQYLKGASPYNNAYALKYNDGDYSLEAKPPVVPESSNDIQHTVKDGETLQNIAFRYYGDSGMWGVIADANDILNPFEDVHADMELIIPNYGGQ